MREAIDAVREAYVAVANGEFAAIPRIGAPSHSLFAMMAERTARDGAPRFGQSVKLVSYNEVNPAAQGTRSFQASWCGSTLAKRARQVSASTARGRHLALRTGAASGVATDLFAAKDASTLAVIGAGPIATDHVRSPRGAPSIRSIRVITRDARKARSFAGRIVSELNNIDVRATLTVREAVAGGGGHLHGHDRARAAGRAVRAGERRARQRDRVVLVEQCARLRRTSSARRDESCVDDRSALEDTGDVLGRDRPAGMLGPSDVALIRKHCKATSPSRKEASPF